VLTDVWPLFGLVLRTPRLELRLPSLEQLAALGELADEGIHDPVVMPFVTPWTDQPPGERGRSVLQWQWKLWAELTPSKWGLGFVVLAGGDVVGTQELSGADFAVTREVGTGSWLGSRHQGRGIGTEMRAAVLALAFDGLGAQTATSAAFVDNAASLGVSRRLGYSPDGQARYAVRNRLQVDQRLRLDRETWAARRTVPVDIEGLAPCLGLLGVGAVPAGSTAPGSPSS
jgi:RimJ/RimL family protein N-acetyltransferase